MAKTKNNLTLRPPVVVVMGHVDHGKTSLLDYIRKSRIAAREAGGITQHLGAYEVEQQGRRITFLDTPGHEAFAAIRQRGAKVADVALLVIAADEGLKPQTLEALSYIKSEKLPFIIVLNKIDRPGANPDKIKQALADQEVYVEEWGGTVPCVPTCAILGEGIDALLEMILLVADMEELTADPLAPSTGIILESTIDMRRGIEATILVLNGTLNINDTIYTTNAKAKVKYVENFLRKRVASVTFSSPCVVTGWDTQPLVGDTFTEVTPESLPVPASRVMPDTKNVSEEKNQTTYNFLFKADMSGSLEALCLMCEQLLVDLKIPYVIVGQSTGDIVLGDIKSAENTNAIIVAFNSKLTAEAKGYYKPEKTVLFEGNIIYHLIEALKAHLEKITNPHLENILARLTVIAVFSQKDKKNHQIVGGQLTEGTLRVPMKCNVVRNEEKIGTGKLLSIKKNKQEFDTCEAPGEFGVQIELREDGLLIQKGDIIEFKK